MMSSGSLHSSSTLLASSTNNSICEVTDLDTDCPSDSADYSLEPPQVSISSHDSPTPISAEDIAPSPIKSNNSYPITNHSTPITNNSTPITKNSNPICNNTPIITSEPDSSSISIYESPLSSIYETPVSSPTYYATPMEGQSPWASPRTSLRSATSSSASPTNSNNIGFGFNGGPPQRGETINHNKPFTG